MSTHDGLLDLLAQIGPLQYANGRKRGLPPVELWNPSACGDIGLEIREDGSWWHEGVRITRSALVELFASILRKDEDGQTYLVTPVEKVIVTVADAPFLGVRVDQVSSDTGPAIAVTTQLGDTSLIGPDLPLRVVTDPVTGAPRPYARIRGRLDARILRAPFYELVSWAEEIDGRLVVWSQGQGFDLGALEGLDA